MDADRVFSSGSGARSRSGASGVPAPLDGELILPRGRVAGDRNLPPPSAPPAAAAGRPAAVLIGAVVAALVGLGAAGGYYAWMQTHEPDTTVAVLGQLQRDLGTLQSGVDTLKGNTESAHQDDAIRSLKKSVDVLKAELDAARTSNAAALTQINAKVDKAGSDPAPKLAEIAARLDRIERQVSSPVTTGSIAAPAAAPKPQIIQAPAAQTVVAQPTDKPAAKPATLGNWIVRDVYDGIALVEGRSGGIREVTPGEFLPGAGEVRSIERRGRNWIVITSRGVIDDSTW